MIKSKNYYNLCKPKLIKKIAMSIDKALNNSEYYADYHVMVDNKKVYYNIDIRYMLPIEDVKINYKKKNCD